MNSYIIEHKIYTLAQLVQSFTYQGFEFCHWDFNYTEGWIGDAWIAKKKIPETNVQAAINQFRVDLVPIVDRIAFVSQCFTMMENEPFLIRKENDNAEHVLFLRYTRKRRPTPLMFEEDQIESLKQLEQFQDKDHVFNFLRESTYGLTFNTRLLMLLSALEGMAGEIKGKRGNKTNKEFIKNEILNDKELYDIVFKYDDGLRNQIAHGKKVEILPDKDGNFNYTEKIYGIIVQFFNQRYSTKINMDVIRPQRSPIGNYIQGEYWIKPKNIDYNLSLKNLVELLDKTEKRTFPITEPDYFQKEFILAEMPADY